MKPTFTFAIVAVAIALAVSISDRSTGQPQLSDAEVVSSKQSASTAAKRGKRGPRGPRGPRGFAGPAGPAAVSSVRRVNGNTAFQGAFGSGIEVNTSTATCPAGTYVSGGGFDSGTIENWVAYQLSSATQYSVIAVNYWGSSNSITAQAICIGGQGLSAASTRSRRTPAKVLKRVEQLQSQVNAERK